MPKKVTTEEFIEKAKIVHGDKYDYSKVVYKKSSDKIKIICPIHGIFEQAPNSHLRGSGCGLCSIILVANKHRLTTKSFIERSINIHNNKYDYSKVEYVDSCTKVCIICPIHGEFWQTPNSHLSGRNCFKCSGNKKHTTDEFICMANKIHNNKYDYSKTLYVNAVTDVNINCHVHGIFKQQPTNHLSGQGCPLCGRDVSIKKLSLADSVSINDVYWISGSSCKKHWDAMMTRCYNKNQESHKYYRDCSVCKEWHKLSNFKKWFDNHKNEYKKGYHLDKDILVKGNRVYSPETCCFVPPRINSLFIKHHRYINNLPIGVSYSGKKYQASTLIKGKNKFLGLFDTPELAFYAYKEAKEKYIKEVADEWKDIISKKVYEAMYNYEVEITD